MTQMDADYGQLLVTWSCEPLTCSRQLSVPLLRIDNGFIPDK